MYVMVLIFFSAVFELVAGYEQFLSSVSGEVAKENYTYYSMSYDGTILIELIPVTGDCDLYVSEKTQRPKYEPLSNCLQSVTCGIDSVIVPKSFNRPVGIGIFGHPSHDVSTYHLMIYRIDDSYDLFHYDLYEASIDSIKNKKEKSFSVDTAEDKKSSFLKFALKFLFEFLIDVL